MINDMTAAARARSLHGLWVSAAVVMLTACSGGSSDVGTSGAGSVIQYTIGGTVTGLTGTGLMLDNNGTDDLAVSATGAFSFAVPLVPGDAYHITVRSQPTSPNQTCTVANGSGIVTDADITGVSVVCVNKTSNTDVIGGTVVGLLGTGLVLQDNFGDNLSVTANGGFAFATPLAGGTTYSVSVLSPPLNPYQNCVVINGAGTAGANDVLNVSVTCTSNPNPGFSIGGTVSGLAPGGTITLQDNGRDALTITANGGFQFSIAIPSGSGYDVTSSSVAGQQSETCTILNPSGTVAGANVTNVTVTCLANAGVTVAVSGLAAGQTLVLQDNGADALTISQNGPAAFPTALAIGSAYAVTIATQPANQTCAVQNGAGTVQSGVPSPVAVTCAPPLYPVGGSVSGVAGTGLVLLDNGGDNLAIAANGSFSFATPIVTGGSYQVGIQTEPPGYACAVSNGIGTVTTGPVSNVTVSCSSIGGLLYVTNGAGNDLSGFAIDFNSGALQPLTQVVAAAGQPNAVVAQTGVNPTSIVPGCSLGSPSFAPTVYVASPGSGTITGFSADTTFPATGAGALTALTVPPLAAGKALTTLDFVAFNPPCELYALDAGLGSIAEFAAAATGTLTASTGSPVPLAATSVPAAAAHLSTFNNGASATYEYVANQVTNTVSAYAVNADGTLSVISDPLTGLTTVATGTQPSGIATTVLFETINAVNFDVPYVYVTNQGDNTISVYQASTATGGLGQPLTAPVATGTGPAAVIQALGYLYVANGGDNTISGYSIATAAPAVIGSLSLLGPPVATGTKPVALAYALVNLSYYLYVVNQQSNDIYVYSIAPATGALTFVSKHAAGSAPTALAIPYNVGGG
jgi:6-phosphogluconolactonase (cycloisomerase 2 family)